MFPWYWCIVFVFDMFQMCLVTTLKEEQQHVCGDQLPSDCGMFVRCAVTCSSVVETAYYSASVLFEECCFYCGTTDNLLHDAYMDGLMQEYSQVRPLCSTCKNKGHSARVWGKRFLKKRRTEWQWQIVNQRDSPVTWCFFATISYIGPTITINVFSAIFFSLC